MEPCVWDKPGEFYSGDCYLVLHTIKTKQRYDLYYLIGKESSVDEKGAVAYFAVELDQLLGDVPVQHREVQDHESQLFVSLWRNHGGLRYLNGGVDSAFHHVTPETYKKRLLHVKGKRSVAVREVPCEADSLNEGDAFVLDAGLTLYVWYGQDTNKYEKLKAAEMVRYIGDDRKGAPKSIIMCDAGEEDQAKFWELLGGKKDVKPASECTDECHEMQHAEDLRLFTMKEDAWELSEHKAPYARADLHTECIYLLDTNSEAGGIIWVGLKAPLEMKKKAMKNAEAWLVTEKRPYETALTRLHEGNETAIFKSMFHKFEVPKPVVWQTSAIAQMRESEVNIADMHKQRRKDAQMEGAHMSTSAQFAARKRSDEKITIWRIENFALVDVPEAQYGEFYDGDSYIVEYVYKPKQGRGEAIIYFWQGTESTCDEKGTSAILSTKLDDEKHKGMATQVRVPMGKEPVQFLTMFDGKMIIHMGGVQSGFRTHKAEECPDDGARLYQIRGTSQLECKAQNVHLATASLNSNDVFVLLREKPVLWKGAGASEEEQALGFELCKRLGSAEPVVIAEGEEPEDFWKALGGKTEYASDPALYDPEFAPRLFHVSNASGALRCEEVFNFVKEDLLEEDVMLLDVKTTVFIWIGSLCNKEELNQATKIARQYLESAPDGRGDVPDVLIRQGQEPLQFTCHFNWNDDPNKHLSDNIEAVHLAARPKAGTTFPLDVLQTTIPEGVDPAKKETYLSENDFQTAFKMTLREFEELPQWKRLQKKKEANLY